MDSKLRTNLIAGTAGHIDHGKTALVRALTGIETDRLREEKARGISIDLGFAHLDLDEGLRIGLVDVPGHERFVRNMLAGVGGIDFVLFVVAANESIKPQTREHFDICRLLRIARGIVVLTKADLAGPEMVELVRMEFEEFAAGSFLENAPVVPVSSATGEGIVELKRKIETLARSIPARSASKRARLPVDRTFRIKGFGTVATGTLQAGQIVTGQELELFPTGKRVRVRGLQVHGSTAERAAAGQRTALNIAGVDVSEIRRGMVLAEPGVLRTTSRFDAELELLPGAKPLKHQAPVHLHVGAAVLEAEVRLLSPVAAIEPGNSALVRILLREPTLLLPGDRFIIRMFSPVTTIGGGTVVDIAPPARLRRPQAVERLQTLLGATPAETIAMLVRESMHGMTRQELGSRLGWTDLEIEQAAARQTCLGDGQYVDPQWVADQLGNIRSIAGQHHKQNPLAAGIPREDLRSRVLPQAPPELFDALLDQCAEVVREGEHVRLKSHRVALAQDEEAALRAIEQAFAEAGLAVPATSEVLQKSGVAKDSAKALLAMLLKQKRLVRAADDLIFHASAIAALSARLATRKGQKFSVPEFKDWAGVSRKYAIPLLELLDRERVTRRDGDSRIVL